LNQFNLSYLKSSSFYQKLVADDPNVTNESSNHPFIEMIAQSRQLKVYVSSLPNEEKKKFGNQLNELMLSCRYNSILCGLKDFEWFYDFEFGNCYRLFKLSSKFSVPNMLDMNFSSIFFLRFASPLIF